jgi:hypothetical protein
MSGISRELFRNCLVGYIFFTLKGHHPWKPVSNQFQRVKTKQINFVEAMLRPQQIPYRCANFNDIIYKANLRLQLHTLRALLSMAQELPLSAIDL